MLPIVATLLSQGLSLLGNAVMAKGQDVIEQKLGVKLETAPPAELRKLEVEHEEFLINAAIQQKKLDIESDKLAVDNTKDSRAMNVSIQTSAEASYVSKVAPYILDFLIILSTFALVAVIFFRALPPENKEMTYLALGSLLTMCGTILNFHRGSSASSKGKDESITNLISQTTK
jgi:hypothetical protein